MTVRAREWRPRLFLATVSTLLTLAVGEGATRALLRPNATPVAEGTPISEISPTLGWRTRPNGAQRIRREDFDVVVSINRLGLRGPEIPYEPGAGARRLAIMGDSFAHGYYASEPETLRGRLAEALKSCRVDVLNAGGPGYSTDQEWLYFKEEISKYHPAEVVLLFYYNDLQFNIERLGTANREKPVFVQRDGSLELVLPVSTGTPAGDREETVTRRSVATFHHSALWAFMAARLQRSRPDWSRTLSEYGLMPELSVDPPAEFLPFGPKDAAEQARVAEMWRRTTELLRHFRDDVRRDGAGFSVFYVPARFEVNDDAWTFVRRRYDPDRPWNRDSVRTRLAGTLAGLDIPLIESTASFRGGEKAGPSAYLSVDGHWNARGNEIAFQSLFPVMRRAFACDS